jgi:translation elongation factor EF-1alpha
MGTIPISIASMGPADHGKSTLFGYVVLNNLSKEKQQSFWKEIEDWERKKPNWFKTDRSYTYVFDRLKVERQGYFGEGKVEYQGTSNVPSHIECTINKHPFLFIDAPGHTKFISKATKGIFQAQSGVMVLAASDIVDIIDIFERSADYASNKRHTIYWNLLMYPMLLRSYGFRHLVVVISKMDQVNYDEFIYNIAVDRILPFLRDSSGIDCRNIYFIPTSINVSDRSDVNVTTPTNSHCLMNWYKGPTFVDTLSEIEPLQPSEGRLWIPVEEIYWKRLPEAPFILTGRIMRGSVGVGQSVQVIPLCDPLVSFNNPTSLAGEVKNIRMRDQSNQLPWIGRLPSQRPNPTDRFEAGHVVGLSLRPQGKFNWDKFPRYFRRGCIITGDGDEIVLGNILKARILIPSYSRKVEQGHTWLVYLYGQKKGDALIIAAHVNEESPIMSDDGTHAIGFEAEVDLLLDIPVAYPGKAGRIDIDSADIVMRHGSSFCAGKVSDICFCELIEVTLTYEDLCPSQKIISHFFKRIFNPDDTPSRWKIKLEDQRRWIITGTNPLPNEMTFLYCSLKKISPKPASSDIRRTHKRISR